MKIRLRTSQRTPQSPDGYRALSASNDPVFTHIGPIQLEVQSDGAIHAIAQDFGETRTYVVVPADAVAFAKEILKAAQVE